MRKEEQMPKINNIVLVHGGFVDGAGWRGVYDILKKDGFNVSIVQNPTISLAGDVSATKLIIDSQPGPVILVGHSYGGAVITEAGLTRTLRDWCTSPASPRTGASQLIP
jgi:pimeloyl-ACP methyl ester carboxylesterase